MSVGVSVEDNIDEVRALIAQLDLTPDDFAAIHARIAPHAETLTEDHLREIARTRHDTARKLQASPTGFWETAANSVSSQSSVERAMIGVTSPGIWRAIGDVVIRPGPGSDYLAIPIHPLAHGKRARAVWDHLGLFALRTGGTAKNPHSAGVLAMRDGDDDKRVTAVYLLVPEVTQKQDATLLPEDAEFLAAGEAGLEDWVDALLS